ncbi:MAG: hypothetical protein ACTH2Q_20090 [Propionibacteriaceae bacterium]
MNPYEGLQNLVDQVHPILQPFIVALAGMIPYVEGEGSAALGVIAGINPVIAGVAGATGNILAVFVVVHFGDRIRSAVKARRARKAAVDSRVDVLAGAPAGTSAADGPEATDETEGHGGAKKSKGRGKLMRWVVRFGVPGASLIGPLALPTHLTAATLVAAGVRRNWVLLWQVIAILLWTTAVTVAATGILTALTG